MNIAVCDDEENVLIYIKKLIEKQTKDCKNIAFSSGEEFENVFSQAFRECRYLDVKKNVASRDLLVRYGTTTRNILVHDIYYIESSNQKIIVSMQDEKLECYGKSNETEHVLRKDFFRIHKGYLVNMKSVERYSRTEVQMKNGSRLSISKYKYQDFINAYLKYILSENAK